MEKSGIDHWYDWGMEKVNNPPKVGDRYFESKTDVQWFLALRLLVAILNLLVIISKRKK